MIIAARNQGQALKSIAHRFPQAATEREDGDREA